MKHSLEIIVSGEVKKIFRLFSEYFGIRPVFTMPGPEEIEVMGEPWKGTRFCRMLREHLGFEQKCMDLDEKKRKEAGGKKSMIWYQCHAGLLECIIPIYIEKRLIGHFVIGQIRCQNTVKPSLRRLWERKRNANELVQAFEELPYIAPEKVQYLLDIFAILIRYVTSQQMVSLKGNLVVQKAREYVRNHAHGPISLSQVSEFVGKSTSTVSHLFRQHLGKPFKQFVIETRLEKFEELMRLKSGTTVRSAAEQVGYSDPYYFSRIYGKYRGAPPSRMKRGMPG